jgi:hypothetical protein
VGLVPALILQDRQDAKGLPKIKFFILWDGQGCPSYLVGWARMPVLSYGMGILAHPIFKAGRMPTPQDNFGYFFIWKSLRARRYF